MSVFFRVFTPVIAVCYVLGLLMSCAPGRSYDLIIANGLVVDGSGEPGFEADIGITGGSIVAIGNLSGADAKRVIDAKGMVVSPGFIDTHTHCDEHIGKPACKANLNYLSQGVTTVVTGNCGMSVSLDVAETKSRWEEQGIGTNVVYFIGHGSVRSSVMGEEPRHAIPEEIEEMKAIVRKAMEEGAWGVTTALEYVPGSFADIEEFIDVLKVCGSYGGFYLTHMRDEASKIVNAIEETIYIGEQAGLPVLISHLKVTGKSNWGLMKDAVGTIQAARDRGVEIAADKYPYPFSAPTGLLWTFFEIPKGMEPFDTLKEASSDVIPAGEEVTSLEQQYIEALVEALSDAGKRERIKRMTLEGKATDPSPVARWGWQDFTFQVSEKHKDLIGRNFVDIAEEQSGNMFDFLADLVADEPRILYVGGSQSEEDSRLALQQDWVMVSSDGLAYPITGEGDAPRRGHPRDFGSQTIVLRKYVREEKLLTLEEAVRKMTSLPATFLHLKDRGILKEGSIADIVVFDPETVRDNATCVDSRRYCSGVQYVLINGKLCIEGGKYNGALEGKVLLRTENSPR